MKSLNRSKKSKKNNMKRTNQKIKSFDFLYRKSSKDKVIDKVKMNFYVRFLLRTLMEQKMKLFYKYEHKNKIEVY